MSSHGQYMDKIKIFSGNANRSLAEKIAHYLGMELSAAEVGQFSDGETFIKIGEMVRGVDCFIINSTSYPVNDHLPAGLRRLCPITATPGKTERRGRETRFRPDWWLTCYRRRVRTAC